MTNVRPIATSSARMVIVTAAAPLVKARSKFVAFAARALEAAVRAIVALMNGRWGRRRRGDAGMSHMRPIAAGGAQISGLATTTPLGRIVTDFDADTKCCVAAMHAVVAVVNRGGRGRHRRRERGRRHGG